MLALARQAAQHTEAPQGRAQNAAMATSLLALLDDIASVLDDVAILSKLAAKKTAGVLGDDLALNAQQVAGVRAERELPVVWAVARGSLRNKAILVPAALVISALAPVLITPLLMVGGAFLCFEGFEKLAQRWLHSAATEEARLAALKAALQNPAVDLVALERDKIKGAVRTDFILSAEIIAITLGAAAGASIRGGAVRMAVGSSSVAKERMPMTGIYPRPSKRVGHERGLPKEPCSVTRSAFRTCAQIGTLRSISTPTSPAAISRSAVTPGLFRVSTLGAWPWLSMRAR